MRRLAVVVPKPDSQTAIDGLEAEGVYDDRRKVREHDADHVELPVTEEPDGVPFERAIAQNDPDPRAPDLDDLLRERGWTDAERSQAPSSWAVLGSVILADFEDCPRPGEVGNALLELHREADTVLDRGSGIDGEHREPSVSVVAGAGDTETVHVEHGTRYAMDLAEVMFSPGNKAERARMGDEVEVGERVLDMFAGIGYFALPMGRAGAHVTAVEHNPTAFRYLVENTMRNGVDGRVHPYRADCRDVVPGFAEEGRADRVVMGYYDATEPDDDGGYAYLDSALSAVAPGGVVHVHEATPEQLVFDRPIERIEAAAADAGRDVEILDTRRVKGYSEGVVHVVVDARMS